MGEEDDAGDATEQIVAIAYLFGTLRNRSEKCKREKKRFGSVMLIMRASQKVLCSNSEIKIDSKGNRCRCANRSPCVRKDSSRRSTIEFNLPDFLCFHASRTMPYRSMDAVNETCDLLNGGRYFSFRMFVLILFFSSLSCPVGYCSRKLSTWPGMPRVQIGDGRKS